MQCGQCQFDNAESNRFCANCGAQLAPVCARCNHANQPGAKYCGGCGASLAAREASASAPAAPDAERRQLTVMFCDIVGSTALSTELDPEDLREILRAYQAACNAVITDFDGHIAKYIGDGILAYFGFPQAHEDDAERAVRAGLGILATLGPLNDRLNAEHGIALGVRIGIHTGLVVAGEMGGGEVREAEAIVGDTPNIAARLQDAAAPNSVVVSERTRRLVDGLFVFDALGERQLKGIARPLPIFSVGGASAAPSRFDAAAEHRLSALIGRKSEVDLMLDRWRRAQAGEAQVVLLSGEAGVGKSRLIRALRDRLVGDPHDDIWYFCSPYYGNSALYPAIDQLERLLGFAAGDTAQDKLAKLEELLDRLALPVEATAPWLGALLGLPDAGRYRAEQVSPQLQRRRTLDALAAIIAALANQNPVLMVVEDAHWIDPSTAEFLTLLCAQMRIARLLLLVAYRPEFHMMWPREANVSALQLNRLSRRERVDLITEVCGDKSMPRELVEQIAEHTDGVPLFIEELTKSVLESNVLSEAVAGGAAHAAAPALAIPASLHDSLMARLDRLGPVKEVAQLAAVIGRTFSHELLAAVAPLDGRALDQALDRLVAAELVYLRGVSPEKTFEFKHALVQDAAYQSLLIKRRRHHHKQIAQALEQTFPAITASEPELLAHHWAEAGLPAHAADYWLAASRSAMQRSAYAEAESHLRKGLAALADTPDTPERARREVALQNALGVCLMPTRGFGNREVSDPFTKAAAIAERAGDLRGLFVALRGKGQYQMISGDLPTAREQTGRILELAEAIDEPGVHIEAHHLGWSALTFTGDFAAARAHAEAGRALYQRARDHPLTYTYSGHDPGVCCRSFGSLALWQLGYPDQALELCRAGEALARDLTHPFSATIAFWAAGMLHLLRRDIAAVRQTGEAMIEHCTEKGFPPFVPMGQIFCGGAIAESGEFDDGVATLRDGIAGVRASGTHYTLPLYFAWLGELCIRGGALDDAGQAIAEGLAMSDANEDRFGLPEFYRLKGELLLARSARNKVEAEACFQQAIALARRQDAKSLELRAVVSLAQLWTDKGNRADARALLTPTYDWFGEGLDTPDFTAARALRDALS